MAERFPDILLLFNTLLMLRTLTIRASRSGKVFSGIPHNHHRLNLRQRFKKPDQWSTHLRVSQQISTVTNSNRYAWLSF